MDEPERLPTYLKNMRRDAEMTRETVAKALGIAESTLDSWETTATYFRLPDPTRMERLLDFYGATVEQRAKARGLRYEEELREKPSAAAAG